MQKVSASQGITAFIDKSGRSWNMATYYEMLTRTSTMQVFHQAKVNEYLAHGEDLVVVTYHTPTCKKCAPWGGKILSLTGETKGYPTMEEAKASGLFHPNCRHTYSLWIEGATIQDAGTIVDEPEIIDKNKKIQKPKPEMKTVGWVGIEYTHNYTKNEAIKRLKAQYGIDFSDSRKYPIDEGILGDCVGWLDSFDSNHPQFLKKTPCRIPIIENNPPSKMGNSLGYYSYWPSTSRVKCIALNGKYFSDPVYFQSRINACTQDRWHVQNATLHHTFVHEFGHYVAHSMEQITRKTAWEHHFVVSCINEFKRTLPASEQELSGAKIVAKYVSMYGSTSESETFAEYFGGKKPREFAKIFGKNLINMIKELGGI